MNRLDAYAELGQSIWLDDLRREYFTNGYLASLVAQGLRGLTSNPTIFEKAITSGDEYDEDLRRLALEGRSTEEIYEALAIADVGQAADLLRPRYEASHGADGFVSLEVNPHLAHQAQATVDEACRLFQTVGRPNLMIKIPATAAGLRAIEEALAQGVNVNVTLIFSLEQYRQVQEAFLNGVERWLRQGGAPERLASVASFFVSRVDTAVDRALEQVLAGHPDSPAAGLRGKIAIANAKLAYACFQELLASERWQRLAAQGVRPQRPLWASTGTKNPAYSDTLYVDHLIGPHTVNTVPPATLQALLDHGRLERSIDVGLEEARRDLAQLAELGIDLAAITTRLLEEGVAAFQASFDALLASLERKRERFLAAEGCRQALEERLGGYAESLRRGLERLDEGKVIARIWQGDHTVWKPQPEEIANRLGWLRCPETSRTALPQLQALSEELRAAGFTHALLLGMGGSSLAPEVLRKTFGVRPGYLDLAVLDSTDPGAVLAQAARLDPRRTLFIVSTKSGGTVETLSLFRYFYTWVADQVGEAKAGEHFIAITDPGSAVENLARQKRFRATLLNDPNIGGRFAALSLFGLAPAALIGAPLEALLASAQAMADACGNLNPYRRQPALNPAARLGLALGECALAGRDKLTLILSPAICSFGDWVEQLIAESSGKEGRGILPVVGEVVGPPEEYGDDRCFVYLRLAGDNTHEAGVLALEYAGHPVLRLTLREVTDLGAQFFLWEMATAIAAHVLGVNPFDQPNVEASKQQARRFVEIYRKQGALPQLAPLFEEEGIVVYGEVAATSLRLAWEAFLAQATPGAYLALQAYLPPTPENDASLLALRQRLRQKTRLAVTSGYGPRYLHSTGQLHKGDAGRGLFVQLTADPLQDAVIPAEEGEMGAQPLTFGLLEAAQALGDRQALLEAGRRVLRFHLGREPLVGLARLLQALD